MGDLGPSLGRFGASMGSSWGGFEAPGGLPGVILLAQSPIFRINGFQLWLFISDDIEQLNVH